jgi:hypothetical protein
LVKKIFSLKLIVSLVILSLTFGVIFTPLEGKKYSYEWVPLIQGNKIRLALIEPEPDRFIFSFPCKLSRDKQNWVIDSQNGSGALQIQINSNEVLLLLENSETLELNTFSFARAPSGECSEVLFFDRSTRGVKYQSNDSFNSITLPEKFTFPIRSWLQYNPEVLSDNVKVLIETSPAISLVPGTSKSFFIIFWLLIGVLTLLPHLKSRQFPRLKTDNNEKISGLILICLGFVSIPKYDDGWYLLISKVLGLDNTYSNVMFPIVQPTGFWHAKLLSLLSGDEPIIFLLRIPSLISIFLIWILFKRAIYPWLKTNYPNEISIYAFWVIWLAYSIGFLITLRPDPLIALFLTILLSLILNFWNMSRDFTYFGLISIIGLSLSTHQSGVIVLAAGLPVLVINFIKDFKDRQFYWYGILWGLCLSLFVIFWSTSPKLILKSLNVYNKLDDIYPGDIGVISKPYEEWQRLFSIFRLDLSTSLQNFLILQLVIFALVATFFYMKRRYSSHTEFLILTASLSSILGLIIAPSKWAWYYGDFVTVFMILVAYVFFAIKKFNVRLVFFMLYFFTSISFVFAFSKGWQSNDFDVKIRSSDLIALINKFNGNSLILGIIFVLIFLFIFNFRDFNLKFFTSLNLILIFQLISPAFIDSLIANNGWTFVRQSTIGVFDSRMRCGLAANTFLDDKKNVSIQQAIESTNGSIIISPGFFLFSPCLEFISTENGKWEMPAFVSGSPIFDQQRLLLESKLSSPFCNEIDPLPSWLSDYCFYQVSSSLKQIEPTKSSWFQY